MQLSLGGLLALAVAFGLFACSGHDDPPIPGDDEPAASAPGDTIAVDPNGEYGVAPDDASPAFQRGAPDPFVLKVGNEWHAYATGSHIPHMVSTDLKKWKNAGSALPKINGKWIDADDPNSWAPSVAQIGPKRFVLYYAPKLKGSGRHCLGRAVADSPDGPFVDDFDGPLYCDDTPGHGYWSIDPSPFVDGGQRYLVWRQDNGKDGFTHVAVRKLADSGERFEKGSDVKIILDHSPGSWEDVSKADGKRLLIENPAMIKNGNDYYLFYSGNGWKTADYATGYAVCSSPMGPCEKKSKKAPWFSTDGAMKGPGGFDFFQGPDGTPWAAWHGWYKDVGGTRQMFIGRFSIGPNGGPNIAYGAGDAPAEIAAEEPAPGVVYRSYNDARHDHLLTLVPGEGAPGWTLEGPAFKLSDSGDVALYRCSYQPDGKTHHFVSTDAGCEGKTPEGKLGNLFSTPRAGAVPLVRCVKDGDHLSTTNSAECVAHTFTIEAQQGYVLPP